MKKIIPFLGLILMLSCTQSEKQVQSYTIEQFKDNLTVRGGSFSSDESKILVTSDESGINNAYYIDLQTLERKQLTRSEKESVYAISYFPEGESFLYLSDQGGNERSHIYMQDEKGNVTDLTPWEGSKSGFMSWSYDEESFYFTSNKRDARYFDLYRMDIDSMKYQLVYTNENNLSPSLISHDQQYLVLIEDISRTNKNLYLLHMETGSIKLLTAHEGDVIYSPSGFSIDDQLLYFRMNEGSDFSYLASYNLENGEIKTVFKADWDVVYTNFSHEGKYMVVGINEDARMKVVLSDLNTGEEVNLPVFKDGTIERVSVSKSEEKLLLSVGSSISPDNMYLYEIASGTLTQLTKTLNPEIDPDDLVEAQVIRFESFDGLEIPAIFYKPHQASANNKVPALVYVHGGPGGQTMANYRYNIQYLVNQGYAILAVNNRGSSGYGKKFYMMYDKRHGEDDLMDCVYGKKYLEELEYIDPDKIGIMGGSYGGYMVMAALSFQPDEFDLGVDIFGVTNWIRTLRSIPAWWESNRKNLYDELGDPYSDDSVRLYRISPLFHASNVNKPLMVLQGANDPRVLQVESDEIVEAVRANGVPVEYIIFDDEGHGFRKEANQIEAYRKILEFLDTYLKG